MCKILSSCYFTFFISENVDVLHHISADNGNIGSSPAVPTTLASAVVASERFTSESVIHKPEKLTPTIVTNMERIVPLLPQTGPGILKNI